MRRVGTGKLVINSKRYRVEPRSWPFVWWRRSQRIVGIVFCEWLSVPYPLVCCWCGL